MPGFTLNSVANIEFIFGALLIFLSVLAWRGVFRSASIFDVWGAQISALVASFGPVGLISIILGLYTLIVAPTINSNLYLFELIIGLLLIIVGFLGARFISQSASAFDFGGAIIGKFVSLIIFPGVILFILSLYTFLLRAIF